MKEPQPKHSNSLLFLTPFLSNLVCGFPYLKLVQCFCSFDCKLFRFMVVLFFLFSALNKMKALLPSYDYQENVRLLPD